MARPTAADFARALESLGRPGGRRMDFLRIHAESPGRASNMRRLARKTGYASWRGMNLQYGLVARDIATAMKRGEPPFITLLVDLVPPVGKSPENISNAEWILVMREEFARGLKRVGWL